MSHDSKFRILLVITESGVCLFNHYAVDLTLCMTPLVQLKREDHLKNFPQGGVHIDIFLIPLICLLYVIVCSL